MIDEADAEEFGYSRPSRQSDNLLQVQQSMELTPAATDALFGADDGSGPPGCFAVARDELEMGSFYDDLRSVEQLQVESYDLSVQDSRTLAVFNDWSECMTDRGYSFESPIEANEAAAEQYSTEQADGAERVDAAIQESVPEAVRDMAVADVRCKSETNLAGIWMAVEAAYQRRLIDQHAADLEAFRDLLARVLQSANEALAE